MKNWKYGNFLMLYACFEKPNAIAIFLIFFFLAANTHVHADHITGTGEIKQLIPDCQSVISKASEAKADKYLNPMDVLQVGDIQLEVRPTPGHTNG